MKRRQYIAAVGAASVTFLAGCGDDGGASGEPQGDVGATVSITGDGYDPQVPSIEAGEAVEWVNDTDEEVTVVDSAGTSTYDGSDWDFSVDIPPGESGSYTFDESGAYGFHDESLTQFNMCGAVIVGDASEDDVSLPCG